MKTYRDIVGDGGSKVVEQVIAQQQRIRRNLAGVRSILAVGSGKGGVGKSTLSMCIAARMLSANSAKPGGRARVAILDADLNGPTQARMAGLRSAPLLPGTTGVALPRTPEGLGVVSLGAAIPEEEMLDFASVSSGDSHIWRATREFVLLGDLLATVEWGELDTLVIDLPPGAERTFQYAEFLGPETDFVLVTVPSAVSRGVVSRSVAALRKTPNRVLGYIENMAGYWCRDCDAVRTLFPADGDQVELDLPRLGRVPFDPQLAAAADHGAISRYVAPEGVQRAIDEAVAAIGRGQESPR